MHRGFTIKVPLRFSLDQYGAGWKATIRPWDRRLSVTFTAYGKSQFEAWGKAVEALEDYMWTKNGRGDNPVLD